MKNDSFFKDFFEPVNLEDAVELYSKTEKTAIAEREKIESRMGKHYEIALLIIEELIPYSLEYYLGIRNKKTK